MGTISSVLRVSCEGLTAISVRHRQSTTQLPASQYPDTTVIAGAKAKGCPDPTSII